MIYDAQLLNSMGTTTLEWLQTVNELDTIPSIKELNSSIDSLTNGEAPESDNMPHDLKKIFRCVLLLQFHEILCQCWQEGGSPTEHA